MADLLRQVTKGKWIRPHWLPEGDVPADAVSDLRTQDNRLSVWALDADRSNLEPVVAALAASRTQLDKLDYTVLSAEQLQQVDIRYVVVEGETPHKSMNSLHRDLIELSGAKVIRLTEVMMPLHRERVSEKRIKELLVASLNAGTLDRTRINEKLLGQLEPAKKIVPATTDAPKPPVEMSSEIHVRPHGTDVPVLTASSRWSLTARVRKIRNLIRSALQAAVQRWRGR